MQTIQVNQSTQTESIDVLELKSQLDESRATIRVLQQNLKAQTIEIANLRTEQEKMSKSNLSVCNGFTDFMILELNINVEKCLLHCDDCFQSVDHIIDECVVVCTYNVSV